MPATRHGDRVGSLVIVLVGVLGAGNRIPHGAIPTDNQVGYAGIRAERRLIGEPQAAARRMILRIFIDEHIAEECQPYSLHRRRRNQMNVGNGKGIRSDAISHGKSGYVRSVDGYGIEGITRGGGEARIDLIVVAEVMIEAETAVIVVVASHLGRLVNGRRNVPERK